MLRPSSTVDARTFRRSARERVFAKLLTLRLFLAPALATLAAVFAVFEPTPWRRVVLGLTMAGLFVVSIEEFVRTRGAPPSDRGLALNLTLMTTAQLAVVTATGGLISPVVPGLLAMTLVGSFLVERPRDLAGFLGLQIPWLWVLAWVHHAGAPVDSLVPEIFGGAQPLERGPAPWVLASTYTFMLFAGNRIATFLRQIVERLFEDAIEERDQALAMHAEHGRALGALSGELAHELKNPLASVKGLAALVARGAEGKSAERLGVMRREADRMQEILDELLTFSRPLVPLSIEERELGELVEDVTRLFEASAAERDVTIEVVRARGEVTLPFDPRKMRQVLINLVTNALDASPAGGTITLTVAPTSEGAEVRVRDEGPGLDEAVRERVFEAGVTTKDHGSGLGLAVARSLARQHGGELTLERAEGGGCLARVTLPRDGVTDDAEPDRVSADGVAAPEVRA